MANPLFEQKRKSFIEPGEIYFWTATINSWHRLLHQKEFKQAIVDSLDYLSQKGNIDVFGFVIMPTHVHFIWRINKRNGKETSQGAFLKYTAHQFKKLLLKEGESLLAKYKVNASNKSYEFWQRDPLAIHLYTAEVAYQKLDYIHNNPLAEHWQLATTPADYLYSSASFYETNVKRFAFLQDLRGEF